MDATKNFVKVEVSTGYDSAATSVVLKAGDGAKLPDPASGNYNLVWWNSTDYADPADDPYVSIVRVTGKATDTLTVVQPSSATGNNYNGETSSNTAQNHNIADKVYKMALSPTYKVFNDIVPKSLVTAKGDIVTASAANTPAVIAAGANNKVLVAASGEASGLKYDYVGSLINAPEGFLINGKIVPSVAANDLIVALKGADGNDPSATNPVYVKIGGVVRSITAALSVTKADATNWCNAGSAELATKEIDYFVYLGYNATDGVVIGFSRIPYATLYSDFSATAANEKYCGISTITNAAAGDNYVNIGRFAATLSAGAGYTWTVPTFTAANLIQRPIYETRTLTYTATQSAGGGTPTTFGTTTTKYKVRYDNVLLYINTQVTNVGSATGYWGVSFPFASANNEGCGGREGGSTGVGIVGLVLGSGVRFSKYDASSLWINNYGIQSELTISL